MKANAAKLLVVLVECLATIMVWGKSFSIDLRPCTPNAHAQAKATRVSAASNHADGALRRVNLDAGAANVGTVAVGDELTFTLFEDVVVTLTLKNQMPSPLGGDVFLAAASGYEGVKNAVVLRTEEGLTVDIQDYLNKKIYKVISMETGVVVQEMEARGGRCGCDTRGSLPLSDNSATMSHVANKAFARKGAVANDTETDETFVDILVAYDRNAEIWANSNGGNTNFAQMAVQRMNTVLANTGLDDRFRFRLVGVVSVSAVSDDLDFALDAATDGMGLWAPIRTARDEVGADIVVLLIDTGRAYGTTGLSWGLKSNDFGSFSERAFSCCSIRAVAQSHTMTHEVGHVMGCGHSDVQSTAPGPQLYSYSAGYYFTAVDGNYHTVMAYGSEGAGGIEVPYFSSPSHYYKGVAVGDETHDNRLTIVNTYAAVSQWRAASGSEIAGGEEMSSEPLEWLTSRDAALTKARAEGKYVFLVCGRNTCGNTTATRDYSCTQPEVRAKLAEKCILWFCDCDNQRGEYSYYRAGLGSYTLPLVCVIDPNDSEYYLERRTGYLTGAEVLDMLASLDETPGPSPAPAPSPQPAPTVCTVTFRAVDDGTAGLSRTVRAGESLDRLPVATLDGYTFDGWFTAASGGTLVTTETIIEADVIFYAHWTEIVVPTEPEPEPTPIPEPAPTNVVEDATYAGELDTSYAKAQTVEGALYKGDALVGTVQVKVGKISKKKGTVKLSASATLVAGGKTKTVTAKATTLKTTGTSLPQTVLAFKSPIGKMTFALAADGAFTLRNDNYLMAEATVGGALDSNTSGTFCLEDFNFAVPGELQEDLLPWDESFKVTRGKWKFAKAATVKWVKDKTTKTYGRVVDTSKGKTNRSGLTLTYAAKTGIFKGSFKAYALEERNGKTKLVKYVVNVLGLVVDGMGQGEATCKKPAGGPWLVTVE